MTMINNHQGLRDYKILKLANNCFSENNATASWWSSVMSVPGQTLGFCLACVL